MTEQQYTEGLTEVEAVLQSVPVTLDQAADVRTLPSRSAGFHTYQLDTAAPTRILGHDPRRKRATIIVADKNGASRGAALGSKPGEALESWGANLPLYGPTTVSTAYTHPPIEIHATGEVWAIACGATCTLTVINEQWAD